MSISSQSDMGLNCAGALEDVLFTLKKVALLNLSPFFLWILYLDVVSETVGSHLVTRQSIEDGKAKGI